MHPAFAICNAVGVTRNDELDRNDEGTLPSMNTVTPNVYGRSQQQNEAMEECVIHACRELGSRNRSRKKFVG